MSILEIIIEAQLKLKSMPVDIIFPKQEMIVGYICCKYNIPGAIADSIVQVAIQQLGN